MSAIYFLVSLSLLKPVWPTFESDSESFGASFFPFPLLLSVHFIGFD